MGREAIQRVVNLAKSIGMAVKTGKVLFGAKSALKNAKTGKARLIIVASNCPPEIRQDLEYYCKLSGIPLIVYDGTSLELGAVCGKPFTVSAMTIREPGDSDIMKVVVRKNV
ncbi:50S ribosomal protein L30e [Candidatus Bathyarchaeota archaeon]|nr:MAG: 50S ribosomal protein L30e [Candidatus Bathyarchaeota archaeon ex4484_40]RJS78602.1 MAG: 50S ribosomal protein L30e [Candidatus Bathyarchaeota archaeon]HDJ04647.1 50S ribosomal protein L30e [Candidatus Bathyarchaeota archaeon]